MLGLFTDQTSGDERYDVTYTGGHVAVWVSDLHRYYREAVRILKPAGRLIVSEVIRFAVCGRGRHTILKSASTILIVDLTVQRLRGTYCTPSRVTWSNSSSTGLSPTTYPLFSLRGVSSSTSRNWAMPAKAGKARQWLGFQPSSTGRSSKQLDVAGTGMRFWSVPSHARSPRPDSKGLLASQMTPHNPDTAAGQRG